MKKSIRNKGSNKTKRQIFRQKINEIRKNNTKENKKRQRPNIKKKK